MNKILEFLYRHLVFILFLILEVGAFLLVINKNDLQRSVAFRYATTISAWAYGVTNSVTDYFGLVEANKLLSEENARLRTELSFIESKMLLGDSIMSSIDDSAEVSYLSAKVIYNTVYDLQNYIIIDKGAVHGIEEDMGVFAPQGVVGVVQRVSENYAVVLPIINPDQVISAKIKDNNQLGAVVWNGVTPQKAKLEEIPSHVTAEAGDSVVTSGFSAIFPEGILIGVIDKVEHLEHTMFCDVDITLAVDFQSLTYVNIAVYRNKKELYNLQKSVEK